MSEAGVHRRRSRVATVTLLVATALVVLVGAVWLLQRRLIYFPDRTLPVVSNALPDAESVVLRTDDDLSLGAWFVPAADPTAPVVIIFNGNAGNRGDRIDLAAGLASRGLAVLLFDYRGYGGNGGRPTEKGLARDARAARAFVDTRWQGPVIYFGESLGSAVAARLAAEAEPTALVLRSPFPSLAAVGRVHYPFLPVGPLLWDDFRTMKWMELVDAPVLVVVGTEDEVVPIRLSNELFEAIAAPKARLVIEGARHNDAELAAGPELTLGVAEFLRTLPAE